MAMILLGNVKGNPGRDGTPGPKGITGDHGTSFVVKGQWSANTNYLNTDQVIDVVLYRGSAYYCKQSNYGSTPPKDDTTNWGLFCSGIERVVGRITLSSMDFSASGTSGLYSATYTFPQGTFDASALCNLSVDPIKRMRNGIQLGAVTGNTATIYASDLYMISGTVVEVYYESIIPTVVVNTI